MEKDPKKFDWGFKTFGDRTLETLFKRVSEFVITAPNAMLTISGPTEVGKTHLLKKAFEFFTTFKPSNLKRNFGYPLVIYSTWENIVKDCFSDHDYIDRLEKCGALIIEDFLSENSNNNYTIAAYEIAYKLINKRVGKFTLIDTNKSESDIEAIDVRILSRLNRSGGKIISINKNTKPFLER